MSNLKHEKRDYHFFKFCRFIYSFSPIGFNAKAYSQKRKALYTRLYKSDVQASRDEKDTLVAKRNKPYSAGRSQMFSMKPDLSKL